MATNGGAHKFKKSDNNWLHKHFEPQQVDVAVASISILGLESLSAFLRTHHLIGLVFLEPDVFSRIKWMKVMTRSPKSSKNSKIVTIESPTYNPAKPPMSPNRSIDWKE